MLKFILHTDVKKFKDSFVSVFKKIIKALLKCLLFFIGLLVFIIIFTIILSLLYTFVIAVDDPNYSFIESFKLNYINNLWFFFKTNGIISLILISLIPVKEIIKDDE